MNVLIYTNDTVYVDWLNTAFDKVPKKIDIRFDVADLVDKQKYITQRNDTNFNLIILDENSYNFDFLLKILLNCKDNTTNIIYLRTVKYDKYMSDFTRQKIMEIINSFYSEAIVVLQDIVGLCNVLNDLVVKKKEIYVKHGMFGLVDYDNEIDYSNFLHSNFKEHFVEGVCLLKQSEYIINILNERINIK